MQLSVWILIKYYLHMCNLEKMVFVSVVHTYKIIDFYLVLTICALSFVRIFVKNVFNF